MSYHGYPIHANYPPPPMSLVQQQTLPQHSDMQLLINAAMHGAMVGLTGGTAMNLHRLGAAQTDWRQALSDTVRMGLTTAAATVAATAVGRIFVRHPMLSVAATLAAGTAVMYALTDNFQEHDDA